MMTKHVSRWGWAAALAVGIVIGLCADRALVAQQSGITRTELTRVDVPGSTTHEAVMAIAEIAPGSSSGRHFHHGVEIGYVLSGSLTVQRPDGSTNTYAQGQAFRNPASEIHDGKNPGAAPVKSLGVYIVEKGKPLAEAAPAEK